MGIISGKEISSRIKLELRNKVMEIKEHQNLNITLCAIIIGEDGASASYIKNISRTCEETGVIFKLLKYIDISQNDLIELIDNINNDKDVHGIIVQLPLPKHIDTDIISRRIAVNKDVDCFNPENMGKLFRGERCLLPCTPKGILRLLEECSIQIEGKNVAIIGRSNIVGKPAALMMLNKNATVTICHSKTSNLSDQLKNKDIIISAVGVPKLITEDMIKEGAIVIDAGTTFVNGALTGDVDFNRVLPKTSYITPVPGGVGAMTTTMLIENVLEAFGLQ